MLAKRFDYCNPKSKSGDPEETGLLPCELDYLYGTPNLDRVENVTLIGSSSSMSECLYAQFKWRPTARGSEKENGPHLITSTSQLRLILNESDQYEYEQMETYAPIESHLRPGRITQYGSNVARLKLIVESPYRRMRLVFAGPMLRRHLLASDEDDETNGPHDQQERVVFVRFSCIIHPVGSIHNLMDELSDMNAFLGKSKHQTNATRKAASKRTFRNSAKGEMLALCDRHEQRVRFAGEYLVIDQVGGQREHGILTLWGFYARHFAPKMWPLGVSALPTRRLYVQLKNGQAFQVGLRRIKEAPGAARLVDVQFGYTSFGLDAAGEFLREPLELDWAQVADGSQEGANLFESAVSGQGVLLECSYARKWADWFEVRTCSSTGNTRSWPGWAFVSRDDEILDSGDFEAQMTASARARAQAIEQHLQVDPDISYLSDQASAPLVVTTAEVACLSPELVGWKAAALAQLTVFANKQPQQFFVPQAYILTKFAYLRMLQRNTWLQNVISELMDSLSRYSESELTGRGDECLPAQCAKLVEFIGEAQLSRLVRKHLLTRMEEDDEESGEPTSPGVVVSASSWVESEGELDSSFCPHRQVNDLTISSAGSHEFEAAIMASFASKFAYERIRYERQHGYPLDLPIAVLIERNIACNKRGALLTCDPNTGDDQSIIIIVKSSNSLPGQTIEVSVMGNKPVINKNSGENLMQVKHSPEMAKPEAVLDEANGGQSGGQIDSKEERQTRKVNSDGLTDEQILRLTEVGQAVKKYMATRQQQCHLEWGFETGSNQLYLFGCRPLTARDILTSEELLREADRPAHAELLLYTRAGLVDLVPYALNPLTLSMAHLRAYMQARLHRECLGKVSSGGTRKCAPQCGSDLYSEMYHTFYGLRGTDLVDLNILDQPPSDSDDSTSALVSKAMEISHFGRPLDLDRELVDMMRSYRACDKSGSLLGTFKQILLKWLPNMEINREGRRVLETHKQLLADLNRPLPLPPAAGPDLDPLRNLRAAYARLKQVSGQMYAAWRNHVLVSLLERHEREQLTRLFAKHIGDPMQLSLATNKFLAQISDQPEVAGEMRSQIDELCRLLEARPDVHEFLKSKLPRQSLEYLQKCDKMIGQKFDQFLEKFGHRSCSEFDLMAASWREEPESLVDLIKSHCQLPATARPEGRGSTLNRAVGVPVSLDQMLASVGLRERISKLDYLKLKLSLVPGCRSHLAAGALTRDVLVLHFDCMRLASRALARELQANFRLPDRELIYFALMDELEPLVRVHQPAIVERAGRRRAMFKRLFQGDSWSFGDDPTGGSVIRRVIPSHWREQTAMTMTNQKHADNAGPQQEYQTLRGTPASGGCVHARVLLVERQCGIEYLDKSTVSGCILVTYKMNAEMAPLLEHVVGLVTELNKVTSYGAVLARDMGLPCVIGVSDVTKILNHNEEILMDADMGNIVRLECDQIDGREDQSLAQARDRFPQPPPPDGPGVVA